MDTQTYFDKLISESDLSAEQKELWRLFADTAPEMAMLEIIDLVQTDPEALSFLTQNIEEKIKALRAGKDWDQIIQNEIEFVKK